MKVTIAGQCFFWKIHHQVTISQKCLLVTGLRSVHKVTRLNSSLLIENLNCTHKLLVKLGSTRLQFNENEGRYRFRK